MALTLTLHFWSPDVGFFLFFVFFHTNLFSNFGHQLSALHFNYDADYLELAQTPQAKGSIPQDAPLQMPVAIPR